MADDRIAKLRAAADKAPDDELAHFSLGSALLSDDQPADAAKSLQRVLAINSQNSKAYELLARAQQAAGHREFAIETLRTGFRIAHKRGDLMPRDAMGEMLKALGESLPMIAGPVSAGGTTPEGATADGFACKRCGSPGPKLANRPFKGPLGEQIHASICQRCWKEWIGMGTKVINELRLPLHDPVAQETYDRHMREFLGFEVGQPH